MSRVKIFHKSEVNKCVKSNLFIKSTRKFKLWEKKILCLILIILKCLFVYICTIIYIYL